MLYRSVYICKVSNYLFLLFRMKCNFVYFVETVGMEPKYRLFPSTTRPGVRLNVEIHQLTGIEVTEPVQIRMHCLLILPTAGPLSQFKILSSNTSKSFVPHSSINNSGGLNLMINVLLPLAWKYESVLNHLTHLTRFFLVKYKLLALYCLFRNSGKTSRRFHWQKH